MFNNFASFIPFLLIYGISIQNYRFDGTDPISPFIIYYAA